MSRRPLALALALALPSAANATDLMQTYELARAGDTTLSIAESTRLIDKEGAVQARAALLPQITGRVVTVASGAHRGGSISLDDLNWDRRRYDRWAAYQQSKLANLLFTLELQRRLTAAGSRVRALAAHPGYTATNLQFRSERGLEDGLMAIGNRLFAQTDEAGARPTLFAASQDLPGASYVGPDGFGEYRGYPRLVGRTAAASDVEVAKRLWALSEELTGVAFPLTAAH